jgi:hypothetical protein
MTKMALTHRLTCGRSSRGPGITPGVALCLQLGSAMIPGSRVR